MSKPRALIFMTTASLLSALILHLGASAQTPQPTTVASAASAPRSAGATGARDKGEKNNRTVRFIGKSYHYRESTGIHTLKDSVRFTSEDTVLTTEAATYNKKTKIASSPGSLKIEDPLNTITGNSGTAYYTTRDAKIRGNVVILARPRDADRNAPEGSTRRQLDSPTTITCESVDYNWGSRIAELTGSLKIINKDRVVTATRAIYDGKAERVRLIGNVDYKNSKGDHFTAEEAVMIIKEGAEDFEAKMVQGETVEFVDELEDTPAPPPTPPAPASEKPASEKPAPNQRGSGGNAL